MIPVYERALGPGWVYPCSAEDIHLGLARLPEDDVVGLQCVSLVPFNSRHRDAHGIYFPGEKPQIHIPAVRFPLTYGHRRGVSRGELIAWSALEIEYGMRLSYANDRWWSVWEEEYYRRFIAEVTLAHEVGHHALHQRRLRDGFNACPGRNACEQFADSYERRMNGRMRQDPCLRKRSCCAHPWAREPRSPRLPQQGHRLYPRQY